LGGAPPAAPWARLIREGKRKRGGDSVTHVPLWFRLRRGEESCSGEDGCISETPAAVKNLPSLPAKARRPEKAYIGKKSDQTG